MLWGELSMLKAVFEVYNMMDGRAYDETTKGKATQRFPALPAGLGGRSAHIIINNLLTFNIPYAVKV